MSWTTEECKTYIENSLDRVRGENTTSISTLRERGFITTSWLLCTHIDRGTVASSDYERLLLQLINVPTVDELLTLLESRNKPEIIDNIFYPGSIILTREMVEACNLVFNDSQKSYRMSSSVSYLDDVSGFDYLSYICGIIPSPRPLVDIVANGFTKALNLNPPEHHGDMRIILASNWRFALSVVASSSYLNVASFSAAHEKNLAASNNGTVNVMCCCTPIDKAVTHIANSGTSVYYLWELSIVSLFNRLKPLISQYKVNAVREHFISIFDPHDIRKGAYSSYRAIQRLEEAIKQPSSIKKKTT